MTKDKFRCSGFRDVIAEDMQEAAQIFATRAARKQYGRKGYAWNVNVNSWSEDGRRRDYQAAIGFDVKPYRRSSQTEFQFRNIWLHVYQV